MIYCSKTMLCGKVSDGSVVKVGCLRGMKNTVNNMEIIGPEHQADQTWGV